MPRISTIREKYGLEIGHSSSVTVRVKKRSAYKVFSCYKCRHKKKRRTTKFIVSTRQPGKNQYSIMTRWYSRTYCEHCYYKWLIVEHEGLRWIQ